MRHFLLLGEGPSDLGAIRNDLDKSPFRPGLMTMVLETLHRKREPQVLAERDYALTTHGNVKSFMKQNPRRIGPRHDSPAKRWRNEFLSAMALGEMASARGNDWGAVYFRDADRTHSEPPNTALEIEKAMQTGFERSGFPKGVPMVPKPRQEAWLLAYYQKGLDKEPFNHDEYWEIHLAGNDKALSRNDAKTTLDNALANMGLSYEDLYDDVRNHDWSHCHAASFIRFRDRLFSVIDRQSNEDWHEPDA